MIDPLRYRSLQEQLEFDEDDSPMQCWQCLQERVSTPAFFLCHDCGKSGDSRPFCEPCFFDYHLTKRKGKEGHKPHPIVQGDPVIVQTLADGDGITFAKMHDWVTLDYTLTTDESDVAIEDTFLTKQPLTFQSGCSGPCIHLQLLGCTEIAAADIMGASDPYCAVYWKNEFVGVTTTKHMTLNPKWSNQTFVLPLAAEFMAALGGDEGSSVLFNAGALLPKLRIELYDWDRLSKNDFLGQATVSDAGILRILGQARSGEADENHTLSFDLEAKQSRGQLGVRVALRGRKLYVHVMKAENLPKADPFSLSDPYCEVYWNDKKIGKTAHIDDTLDPVWDLEIFSTRVDQEGPSSIEQSTLRIVCLDWDQFGSDDVLGQIELAGWQVKQLAESKDGDEVVSDNEGAMGEADMEKVFDFIRLFQEHEMEEAGLGKMVVGVPQDPNILKGKDLELVNGAAEVEPPKKKKRKRKRNHGAAEASTQKEAHGEEAEADQELNNSQAQPPETLGSDADAARNRIDDNRTELPGVGPQAESAQESHTAAISAKGMSHECRTRDARRQADGEHPGQECGIAAAKEEGGHPPDQARVSEVCMGLRSNGDKECVDLPLSSEEHKRNPDAIQASRDILNVDTLRTNAGGIEGNRVLLLGAPAEGEETLELGPSKKEKSEQTLAPAMKPGAGVIEGGSEGIAADAGFELPNSHALETKARDMADDQALTNARDEVGKTAKYNPDTEVQLVQDTTQPDVVKNLELDADVEAGVAQGSTVKASLDTSNVSAVETEGKKTASDQTLLSEAPRKGKNTPESILDMDEQLAQDVAPTEDVPSALQTVDAEKEGAAQSQQSSAVASPRAERDGKAAVQNYRTFYRDANVQRFEEDRGVLVEYLDDESSAWVETKFIPRLQIRLDAPIARNVFQRLWDLRHKVFNLHKRVLNVKRGMKVLMGVAMTGSRMQFYPLELTDEQSGANFVRGTVDCRFLHHTRGSVLRGLDVAVSHMSLGERARVEVRSDYGFGEVYASRNVPPYATLVFVAQVAAIGHHKAKWIVIRRALKDRVDDALFRFRSYLSSSASSYGVVRRLIGLLRSLRRKKNVNELVPLVDEEQQSFGNPAVAVEEGEATKTAFKEA